jgi:hypothetical protein
MTPDRLFEWGMCGLVFGIGLTTAAASVGIAVGVYRFLSKDIRKGK